MRALLCIAILSLGSSAAGAQEPSARDADPRTLRVERWLTVILHHRPGEFDAAAEQLAGWSHGDLQALSLDAVALSQLMRDPRLSYFTVRTPRQRGAQQIRYTPRQLDRMRILACAAAGLVRERFCVERRALEQLDEDLLRLSDVVAAARKNGDADNYLLRRGAMLHADVAMSSSAGLFGSDPSAPRGSAERLTISVDDGRETAMLYGAVHWDIARALVDAVRPRGDPMVRLWYHATAAWMQARGYHENTDHLYQGLRLFPKDPDLLFLSGCEHESFARPSIQAAVRSVSLPPGFELAVRSADDEIRQAENLFRDALDVDPDHAGARLRLGRALLMRGRPREAAEELRRLNASANDEADEVLKYFASMFLGAAEEALGNYDEADAQYSAASALYPDAQSPHIAQSALARRRGDRAGALSGIERVFQLAAADPPGGDDPWWTYDLAAGRNAEELLEQLKQLFQETPP